MYECVRVLCVIVSVNVDMEDIAYQAVMKAVGCPQNVLCIPGGLTPHRL